MAKTPAQDTTSSRCESNAAASELDSIGAPLLNHLTQLPYRPLHKVFEGLQNLPSSRAQEIIDASTYPPGSALNMQPDARPTRGNTTCLGKMDLQLEYGEFSAYLFRTRDVNGYVIALTKGDITTSEDLLIRTHSECITSETLNACDCDCVEQLNGALEQIAREGRGVLFYLRQEGRGAGYEAKAIDRMIVIASNDQIGTFDAYNFMGLPRDVRDYSSINDIVYLLGINAGLTLMTNNHRKISGLETHGLKVAGTKPHSFPSNPFNQHYMSTKAAVEQHTFDPDHILDSSTSDHVYPENRVHQSYVLQDARRFIHRATYWLPIRPPSSDRILPTDVLKELGTALKEDKFGVMKGFAFVEGRTETVKVSLDERALGNLRAANRNNQVDRVLARHPYFFSNHVYLDEMSNLVYPVLEHDSKDIPIDKAPLVRIHTESILGRLPLADNPQRAVFQDSVQKIVENGRGLIVLYPKDARGNGIGALFEEAQLIGSGRAKDPQEASQILGTDFDARDYTAIARLIKHHYPQGKTDLILSHNDDTQQKADLLAALAKVGVTVGRMINAVNKQGGE